MGCASHDHPWGTDLFIQQTFPGLRPVLESELKGSVWVTCPHGVAGQEAEMTTHRGEDTCRARTARRGRWSQAPPSPRVVSPDLKAEAVAVRRAQERPFQAGGTVRAPVLGQEERWALCSRSER